MTWPPPRPAEPKVPHRPWDPRHPEAKDLAEDHERLVYVVIDEIVEEWVGLSASLWPHADSHGRLRFIDPKGAVDLSTTGDAFRRFLNPKDPGAAEPRVGRTFAAQVKEATAAKLLEVLRDQAERGEVRIDDLGQLLQDPVDITHQGRQLAKLASYGAMLSTLPSELAGEWNLEEEEET